MRRAGERALGSTRSTSLVEASVPSGCLISVWGVIRRPPAGGWPRASRPRGWRPARGRSAVIRPSQTTRTRSAMPSTSGSSLEIIRIAMPWPASSDSRRCTSDLVPTSMPRVGSSMISRSGSVASHLAMTTFCWLPPLMVRALMSRALVLTSSRPAHGPAARFSAPVVMSPARASPPRITEATLRATDASVTRPCARRSSGTKAMPASMAARGLRRRMSRPLSRTRPAS